MSHPDGRYPPIAGNRTDGVRDGVRVAFIAELSDHERMLSRLPVGLTCFALVILGGCGSGTSKTADANGLGEAGGSTFSGTGGLGAVSSDGSVGGTSEVSSAGGIGGATAPSTSNGGAGGDAALPTDASMGGTSGTTVPATSTGGAGGATVPATSNGGAGGSGVLATGGGKGTGGVTASGGATSAGGAGGSGGADGGGAGGATPPPGCGDGVRVIPEQCDDGNTMPFDGCSSDCRNEPICIGSGPCTSKCGDGIVLGEECDDGNTVGGDGCSPSCTVEPGYACSQPPIGDSMPVSVVYRDFRAHTPAEFEANLTSSVSAAYPGMVQSDLDADGKPVYTGLTAGNITSATFAGWYRNTDGVNHATATTLALWDNHNGTYVNRWGSNGEQWIVIATGQTLDGTPLFFPVDGDTFTPAAELSPAEIPSPYAPSGTFDKDSTGNYRQHNFSFTSEIRYWFKYEAEQSVRVDVLGDDDVWVFINKKLAIDVGGVHLPMAGSVTLDAITAATLGLVDGSIYEVAVFQAERHIDTSTFRFALAGFNTAPSACKPN